MRFELIELALLIRCKDLIESCISFGMGGALRGGSGGVDMNGGGPLGGGRDASGRGAESAS